jgi:glucosamine-phosphate N-acetyltransferase
MKDIIVRDLALEDLTEDSGFYKSLKELASVDIPLDKARDIYFNRMHAGVRTLVAIIDEQIVGTASLVLEYKFIHKGSIIGHIEDVSIDYDYQKMGIGKMLVQELLQIAKDSGCYKAVLHCDEDKVAFYQKLGFYRIDGMRIDLGEQK